MLTEIQHWLGHLIKANMLATDHIELIDGSGRYLWVHIGTRG